MKFNTLKISLIVSLIGIFLLLLLSNILEPELMKIKEINKELIDKKVKIQGIVFRIENKEDFQILSIKDDTAWIDVLINDKLNLTNTPKVTIIGIVQEYNTHLQISADKIIK